MGALQKCTPHWSSGSWFMYKFTFEISLHNTDVMFCSDFDYFFDAVHGNCYVFNAGWNWPPDKAHFYSHRAGRRYGK